MSDYDYVLDQHVWVQKFKLCGGKLQSPISMSSYRSIALPLPALEVIGYHDFLPGSLGLKNNGHSGKANQSLSALNLDLTLRFQLQ